MRRFEWIVAAVLLVPAALAPSCVRAPAAPSADAAAWWAHVEVLAADGMEGRDTGSEGYRRAAEYVAGQFEAYGAAPGAGDGYLQPVGFQSRALREVECRLERVVDGVAEIIPLGDEATISVGLVPAESIDAPLAFVGYGMSIPEIGYDDLDGVDLHGRIAVYISGGPASIDAALRAHAQSSEERWKALKAAGARGMINVSNPLKEDVPWERGVKNRFQPRLTPAEPALHKQPGLEFAASLNGERAARWFEGTGITLDTLLALATREERLPAFEMPGRVRGTVRFDQKDIVCHNVVGIIPGSDPALKDEYIVLSGHLDGYGIGAAVDGDSIYNGAMDNASGIATMIEIARMAKEKGAKPRRSLVLLAVTGEEKGLLGSRHYAFHPTVPGNSIVANVNMDMYMPIVPFELLTIYGRKESDLGDWIVPFAEKYGAAIQDDPEPHRRIFIRSDQYNFILAGVPSLSFKIGFEKDSPGDRAFNDWLKRRYHAPSDDLDQPVDREAAVAVTRMLYDFCMDLADRDARPRWKDDSFFKRFERAPVAAATGG
jgi:hypothetical protein